MLNLIKKLPVGAKVGLAPVLCTVCLVAVGGLGLYASQKAVGAVTHVIENELPRLESVQEAEGGLIQVNGSGHLDSTCLCANNKGRSYRIFLSGFSGKNDRLCRDNEPGHKKAAPKGRPSAAGRLAL